MSEHTTITIKSNIPVKFQKNMATFLIYCDVCNLEKKC